MPAYKYNFKAPVYQELTIQKDSGKIVGTLRLKPSTILWKPGSGQDFYSVSLDSFAEWIVGKESGAKKVKQ